LSGTSFPQKIRDGIQRPANWWQLSRFAAVGASGYVVNLAVFALLTEIAELHYVTAGIGAFVVAVSNNFALNRRWTFRASGEPRTAQASRFLIVSLCGLALNLVLLRVLVAGLGTPELVAQAIAVACVMPLNFAGNKLWTFSFG